MLDCGIGGMQQNDAVDAQWGQFLGDRIVRLLTKSRALALLLLAFLSSMASLLIRTIVKPKPSDPLISVNVEGKELTLIRENDLLCWRWTSGPIFVEPPPKVTPSEVVTSFTITNASSLPLEFSKDISSCGCTTFKKEFEAIPPGGSGKVNVSVSTRYGGEIRRKEYVLFETNSEAVPKLKLELDMSFYPRIQILVPREPAPVLRRDRGEEIAVPIILYQPASEAAEELKVLAEGNSVRLTRLAPLSEKRSGTVLERSFTAYFSPVVSSDAEAANTARSFHVANIRGSAGRVQLLQQLVFEDAPPITFSPEKLFFRDASLAKESTQTVQITGDTPFQITRIDNGDHGLSVTCDLEKVARVHDVSISCASDPLDSHRTRAPQITFFVSHPVQQKCVLSILILGANRESPNKSGGD